MSPKNNSVKDFVIADPWFGSHQFKIDIGQDICVKFDKRVFNSKDYGTPNIVLKSDFVKLNKVNYEDDDNIIIWLIQPVDEKVAELLHKYESGINLGAVIITFTKKPMPIYISVFVKGNITTSDGLKSGLNNFGLNGGYGGDAEEPEVKSYKLRQKRYGNSPQVNYGNNYVTKFYQGGTSYEYHKRVSEIDIYTVAFAAMDGDVFGEPDLTFDVDSLINETSSVKIDRKCFVPLNCMNKGGCNYGSQYGNIMHMQEDFCRFCGAIVDGVDENMCY